MSLDPGTRLGPYEIVGPLGAGGMGEVYRARDTRLGRDVAIKVLPAVFSADPERVRRFEQEARAAAALNHPNILAVHLAADSAAVFAPPDHLLFVRQEQSTLARGQWQASPQLIKEVQHERDVDVALMHLVRITEHREVPSVRRDIDAEVNAGLNSPTERNTTAGQTTSTSTPARQVPLALRLLF